jgi:hypothetical protein
LTEGFKCATIEIRFGVLQALIGLGHLGMPKDYDGNNIPVPFKKFVREKTPAPICRAGLTYNAKNAPGDQDVKTPG